jgi:hypothetical protein
MQGVHIVDFEVSGGPADGGLVFSDFDELVFGVQVVSLTYFYCDYAGHYLGQRGHLCADFAVVGEVGNDFAFGRGLLGYLVD